MAAVSICGDLGAQENKVCHCFQFYFVLSYTKVTNNVVIVSGELQKDSAIHVLLSILP